LSCRPWGSIRGQKLLELPLKRAGRRCRCARLCWKAEALVQAIQANPSLHPAAGPPQRRPLCSTLRTDPRPGLGWRLGPRAGRRGSLECAPSRKAGPRRGSEQRLRRLARGAGQANDVNSLIKYVQRKNDCNLHIAVFPPLTVAAGGGFSEVCRVLISGGAKVDHAVPEPRTAVYVQCSFCLKMAAHVPNRANTYECSMCHELTTVKDGDKGGDAIQDATDHVGLTALHAAVKVQGHVDVVNALVQHGAPVDAATARGNTPLLFAAGGGHVDCARIMLRVGADVNKQNNDGDTPLHRAVKEGHVKMVNLLLDKGATKEVKNRAGHTPSQIADRHKKTDVVNALALHQGPKPAEAAAPEYEPTPAGEVPVMPQPGDLW